ncbi:glycosyltransferase family 39 protein [Nocardia sp. CDC159]|uniref:Glycosyltransferase family 39 protein n=1 Tax=Nocardia pulmonis TaxID=2951408 RepID=A0A9X2E7G1_9NOCA|nr:MULTISPECIES: glycosyltransferase family 39 protein [Nocardia]MCM6775517.1 glycosyltransferase family 39 protein [Nocardia pulmonis]MCM6787749.1 glycosyltransferase family 39 protein [Nocardia sp. CDC159]
MTTVLETGAPQGDTERPPFATVGVTAVVAISAVALLASIGRYGFFGDELYFIAAGRRLAESYADQGPLVPAIARLMDELAPGSLVAQRLPSVLVTLAAIVVSAQTARELGGSRGAQVLTAVAYAVSPFLLIQGTQLATNSLDTALWVAIGWLVVRWVRTRRADLLFWAGVVTAIDMQVKWLVPFFWAAIAVGVLIFGPRAMLRQAALWWGAALVVLTMLPSLFWQARHGWPQLGMGAQVAAEQETMGGRLTFVPIALAIAGLLGVTLLVCGMVALLRLEALRPYRFFAVVPIVLLAVFLITDGRPYYVLGCYPVVMAAGAVLWTRRAARWRTIVAALLSIVSAAVVVWALPVQPERNLRPAADEREAAMNMSIYAKLGWPELARATAAAYRSLPEADRARAVVIADSYWQASALDVARPDHGLPAVYSPNRGFGYFGTPPDSATTVVWVGGDGSEPRARCAEVSAIGRADSRLGFPGITRDVTLWRCDNPKTPWSQAWSSMMRLG